MEDASSLETLNLVAVEEEEEGEIGGEAESLDEYASDLDWGLGLDMLIHPRVMRREIWRHFRTSMEDKEESPSSFSIRYKFFPNSLSAPSSTRVLETSDMASVGTVEDEEVWLDDEINVPKVSQI
jgi:hypothetical protein